MKEERKTKNELIRELQSLKHRIARLEESETQKCEIEKYLHESEAKFSDLAEQSPNMIFINRKGSIIYANSRCEEIMGYTREEFYSPEFDFLSLIAPESVELVRTNLEVHLRGNEVKPYEYSLLTKNGERIEAIINTRLIDFEGDKAIMGIVTDVTARKETERALRISEERYRKLVENATVGVVVAQDGLIKFSNPRVSEITGFSREDLLSKPIAEFIHPDYRDLVMETHRKRVTGERVPDSYEMKIINKDGKIQWLEIAGVQIDWEGRPGALNFILDITERKNTEAEKKDLREKLNNAKRMEAIGVLAGGVAHDLNNVLGPLVAYPQLIRMRLEPDSPIRITLEKIELSAQRAADIVQDLLSLARKGRYELRPIDINELIETYLKSSEYAGYSSKFRDIALNLLLDCNVQKSYGSSVHLFKVIMNLVNNALDAMPNGGTLTVRTECRHIDGLPGGFSNIEKGKYNIISVSDTGIGIEEKDINRVFEPFYTRKRLGGNGSGLGLAIVYGVIKDHNGYVDVFSKPDGGSSFYVYLPAIEIDNIESDEVESVDIRGNERILVVDDVPEQRDLARTILSSLGYNVETVPSGEEAIRYLSENDVDIVILDMIMTPGMDGLDTYRKMVEINPGQAAVISTGFAETDRVREAQKLGVDKVIKKPYTMQVLGKAIRETLAAVARKRPGETVTT